MARPTAPPSGTQSAAQIAMEVYREAFDSALASPDVQTAFDRTRVRVPGPPSAQGRLPDVEGVPVNALADRAGTIKTGVLAGLDRPEHEAMRAYVARSFPALGNEYPVVGTWRGQQCTTPGFALRFQQAIRAFLTRLRAQSDLLLVDLDLRSTPPGATVLLQAKGGGTVHHAVTDGPLRLFRGLYTYTVRRDGFADGSADLDLVTQPGTRLRCALRPVAPPLATAAPPRDEAAGRSVAQGATAPAAAGSAAPASACALVAAGP